MIFCVNHLPRLEVSCESSAQQRIHMKQQVLFSLINNEKICNSRLSSAAVVIGALRVKAQASFTSKQSIKGKKLSGPYLCRYINSGIM